MHLNIKYGKIIKMENNQISQKNSDQDDTIEDAKAVSAVNGAKFGFLVASLPVGDDVKEALLVLAEKLSSEELGTLINALEVAYLNAQTQAVDADFKNKLQQLKSETDQKDKQLNDEFLQKLETLDKRLSG